MGARKPLLVLLLSLCVYCSYFMGQHFYATADNLGITAFSFANFKVIHFHALLVKSLETVFVGNVDDCTFLCFKHSGKCVSFNVQAEPTQGHILQCELLGDDIFHSPEKFQGNGTFHHYALQTQCMLTNPCRNGGTCLPDYASNSYQCNCTQPYSGRNCGIPPPNCMEYHKAGHNTSGLYNIDPDGLGAFDVFCDQTTAGGGWTVFQKRLDGSVDFYRGWVDYKQGFGNLNGEFWLGLDKIHRLTSQTSNKLRVELEDFNGTTAYAEYETFAVSAEASKYQLSLGAYSGTAGDSLSVHHGMSFSTKDQDNDLSNNICAVKYKGAWWHKSCHFSNLNGLYHHGQHASRADGVNWYHWKGYFYSAKRAEMKARPVSA